MQYINPASFMPNADFRANPLQGAFAGASFGTMQNLLDRSYRDSDLDYLKNLHDLQMAKAKDPQTLAEIQAGTQEAQNRYNVAQDPSAVQAPISANQATVSNNQTRIVQNQTAQEASRNALAMGMNEELKALPDSYFTQNPNAAADWWKGWQQRWQDAGVQLPPSYSPEFRQQIAAKASAAVNTGDYAQKIGSITAEGDQRNRAATTTGQYHLQGVQTQVAGNTAIQAAHDQNRLSIANLAADTEKTFKNEIINVAKGGDVAAARGMAERLALQQADLDMKGDIYVTTIQAKMASDDPQVKAQAMQEYTAYRQQKINQHLQEWNSAIDQAAASGGNKGKAGAAVDNALRGTTSQPASTKGFPPPPSEAIGELKKNPSPQMRQYFEQTFGPGSADKALNGN